MSHTSYNAPMSPLIVSREKALTVAKKIVLHLYFNNKAIFDLQKLMPKYGGEMKKILEVIFILEGIGLVFRISESCFIFQGFEGMIHKFHCSRRLPQRTSPSKKTTLRRRKLRKPRRRSRKNRWRKRRTLSR